MTLNHHYIMSKLPRNRELLTIRIHVTHVGRACFQQSHEDVLHTFLTGWWDDQKRAIKLTLTSRL